MELEDFLGPNPSVIELSAKDRWEAIDELVGHLVATNKIKPENRDTVVAALKHRENAMSTGVGYGIAIPHASSTVISDVVGVVGRSEHGIEFEALDGKPVKLVMLFLVPAGDIRKHLNTLANLAKLLHQRYFRDGL